MSIKGLVVHFRRDLDDHEAERTIDALMMIKEVIKVSPVAAGYEDDLNRQRVKREPLDKIGVLLSDDEASS
ncbi:hypothetical protein WMF39_35205 [Sorangium sp. So ce1504]|uniref:hypothetical protein n=1 Tax=Sorangium sp. So ce1504 TaxID=3133337 RepID=UPI003F5F5F2F